MSRSLQLGLRTGDLFQTPSVPRSCSGIISKTIIVQGWSGILIAVAGILHGKLGMVPLNYLNYSWNWQSSNHKIASKQDITWWTTFFISISSLIPSGTGKYRYLNINCRILADPLPLGSCWWGPRFKIKFECGHRPSGKWPWRIW